MSTRYECDHCGKDIPLDGVMQVYVRVDLLPTKTQSGQSEHMRPFDVCSGSCAAALVSSRIATFQNNTRWGKAS